jgi:hypothetical protein
MRSIIRFAPLLMLGLMVAGPSAACMFDTDCEVGSRCLKPRGALHGVCAGGLTPGRPEWSEVEPDPLELDETHGAGCAFDADCGVGLRCVKEPGALSGVCVSGSFERRLFREPGWPSIGPEQGGRPCHSRFDCGIGELCLMRRGFGPGRCVRSR